MKIKVLVILFSQYFLHLSFKDILWKLSVLQTIRWPVTLWQCMVKVCEIEFCEVFSHYPGTWTAWCIPIRVLAAVM